MIADPVKEVLYWYEKLQIEAWARYPFPKLCAILLHTQSGHVQDGHFRPRQRPLPRAHFGFAPKANVRSQ